MVRDKVRTLYVPTYPVFSKDEITTNVGSTHTPNPLFVYLFY